MSAYKVWLVPLAYSQDGEEEEDDPVDLRLVIEGARAAVDVRNQLQELYGNSARVEIEPLPCGTRSTYQPGEGA